MRILAIDPAARAGWAIATTKDRIDASGVWSLGKEAQNRPGHLALVMRRTIGIYNPTVIAFELATFGGKRFHVMRRMNELSGVIQAVAGELGIECWAFGISSWKARSVGKGNAKKLGVIRGLQVYYGINVTDSDEADACGIALAAQQGPPPEPVKKVQRRVRKAMLKEPRLFR